jgi:uncharacterized protein (DUF58 family)
VKDFLFVLVVLFLVAAVLAEDFAFSILYLLAGTYFFSRLWTSRAINHLSYERDFTQRVFCGEDIPVKFQLTNRSIFPLLWLRLQESVPTELAPPIPFKQVISLGPRGKANFTYTLKARKRGYYSVGPMFASTGDLFGLGGEQRNKGSLDTLTVYPRIIHLTNINIPSNSPMGTLRHHQPIYEDPSRIQGKRDYVHGDSLRRVDWKATASTGRLQVKQFEPSMSLTTAIFLNLHSDEYGQQAWIDGMELAIVIAASLAKWVISKKQMVGLITNGIDPIAERQAFRPLFPRRGHNHLMHLFDILARVEYTKQGSFVSLLDEAIIHLTWGTTLMIITGQADDALFDELFRLRQNGFNAVLILVGYTVDEQNAKVHGQRFGFPVFHFRNEMDLDIWRQ